MSSRLVPDKSVKIGVVNVNSLRNKLFYISNFIDSNKIAALGICETWLNGDTPSSFVALDDFTFFRKDSPSGIRKHGVGLYLRSNIDAIEEDVGAQNILSVHVKSWDLHILICYRPPSNSPEENKLLTDFIGDFVLTRRVLLMGDFNLPTLKWPVDGLEMGYVSPVDQAFSDLFAVSGLTQTVHLPTYFPSGNVLDLVLTSEPELIGGVSVEPPFHTATIVLCWLSCLLRGLLLVGNRGVYGLKGNIGI